MYRRSRYGSGLIASTILASLASAAIADDTLLRTFRGDRGTQPDICGIRALNGVESCLPKVKPDVLTSSVARGNDAYAAVRAKNDQVILVRTRAMSRLFETNPNATFDEFRDAGDQAAAAFADLQTKASGKWRVPLLDASLELAGGYLGSKIPASTAGVSGLLSGVGGKAGQASSDYFYDLLDPGDRRGSEITLQRERTALDKEGIAIMSNALAWASLGGDFQKAMDVEIGPLGVSTNLGDDAFKAGLLASNPSLSLPDIKAQLNDVANRIAAGESASTVALEVMQHTGDDLRARMDGQIALAKQQAADAAEQQAMRDEMAHQQQLKAATVDAAQAALYGIEAIVGLSDPDLARTIGVVNDTAMKVYDGYAKMAPLLDAGGQMAALGAAGLTMGYVGLAIGLYQMVSTSGQQSEMAAVMSQIGVLQQQIADLDKMVRENFAAVHQHLDEIADLMASNFELVLHDLSISLNREEEIRSEILGTRAELRLAVRDLRSYVADVGEMVRYNTTRCTEVFDSTVLNLPDDKRAEKAEANWAECVAGLGELLDKDLTRGLYAGQPLASPDDLFPALLAFGFGKPASVVPSYLDIADNVTLLRDIALALGSDNMPASSLPNPAKWQVYAATYRDYAEKVETVLVGTNPGFTRSNVTAKVVSSGDTLELFYAALSPANTALYQNLIRAYEAKAAEFIEAVTLLRRQYEIDQLEGWTWEQLGWGSPGRAAMSRVDMVFGASSTPAERQRRLPHNDGKITGVYTHKRLQGNIQVPKCGGKGKPALTVSGDLLAERILQDANPAVGAVGDLDRGDLAICYMLGSKDRGKNPGDYDYNSGKSYIWLYRIGSPVFNFFAWESGRAKDLKTDHLPKPYNYQTFALPKDVRISKKECPNTGVSKSALANWVKKGTPIGWPAGLCRNEWDMVASGDAVKSFGTDGGGYVGATVQPDLPSIGPKVFERMDDLENEHEKVFADLLQASLTGGEITPAILEKQAKKVLQQATDLFGLKALIGGYWQLGAPDLFAMDDDLVALFYGDDELRLFDPAMFLNRLSQMPSDPVGLEIWSEGMAHQRADQLRSYLAEASAAAGTPISLNSGFTRLRNDLLVIQGLQQQAETKAAPVNH